MKLLFVENRYTTQVFERVATGLREQGHAVAWLVQNHRFAPRGWPQVHRLPYPGSADLQPLEAASRFAALSRIDRGIRYFGGTAEHYGHYARHIAAVLDTVAPDVVFGESTQFHELITVALCRDRGIPFLHPAATRLPHGRITFLVGDTLETCLGSGELMPDAEAQDIVAAVADRRYVAFTNAAVSQPAVNAMANRLSWAGDKLVVLSGWLQGERYVTPAPWNKHRLERRRQAALVAIDTLAAPASLDLATLGPYVLYPMQMQPETNIDVWGAPHHDQARIIADAATSLAASGHRLVVKLNPTAKYELLEPGLLQAMALPNVTVAPRAMAMAPLFRSASALLSVTGSVIYECIFASKPVYVLGRHALSRLPGVTPLDAAGQLGAALLQPALGDLDGKANAVSTIKDVVSSSYAGYWFDPLTMQQFDTAQNIAALTQAFADQLAGLARQGQRHDVAVAA